MTSLTIFCLAYAGIAMGKIPGLAIDRVGVALLGAIAMAVFGVVTTESAVASIDLPTILLLYSLMIVSAQLRLGGFYTWFAFRITSFLERPKLFLLASMVASAFLSALLANDIVCFAFTPVLTVSLIKAKLNPVPFLLGLAVSSNIGSAATIIGNPQNMLIGQVGRLDFAEFFLWCAPPSLLSLLAGYLVILRIYRNKLGATEGIGFVKEDGGLPDFNPWQSSKGIAAIVVLVGLFFTSAPRELSAICVAGLLLCSRKMKSADILALVDWRLLTLFCSLFVVIHGISQGDFLNAAMEGLAEVGLDPRNLYALTAISVVSSNLVSNVPAVMVLVNFLDPGQPAQWYALALSSTFAGNLFLLGSIANLIVVEQAARFGVGIDFMRHAAVGVPATLVSLAILVAWVALLG
jgi:Na+/H+ antiporter NhaD/arsenite permease-like protein